MSLDYDLTEIKDARETCYYQTSEVGDDGEPLYRLRPVTETLIWMQMSIYAGGKITTENMDEVFARIQILETVDGAWRHDANGNPVPVTWRDVYEHVGLRTNACENNKTAFKNAVMKSLFRRAHRIAGKERQEFENSDGLVKLKDAVAGRP